ncbi:MAG: hypothetical protein HZA77_05165 [Candidatus Schekmanbacteria bacterium]|nr:hypothetical protein [Candidatus Schekmanbacteria bacterium]
MDGPIEVKNILNNLMHAEKLQALGKVQETSERKKFNERLNKKIKKNKQNENKEQRTQNEVSLLKSDNVEYENKETNNGFEEEKDKNAEGKEFKKIDVFI